MYETPKLNLVGEARKVVLGFWATGVDIDTTWCNNNLEYAEDSDDEKV